MVKRFLRAAAVLAATAFMLAAAPAHAHPAAPDTGVLHLQVTDPEGLIAEAVLVCPGGWFHPHGAQSCSQLAEAGGDIAAVPSGDGHCHLMYRPVTVTAHGHWNGAFRSFEARFGNLCQAVQATGGKLFDLA